MVASADDYSILANTGITTLRGPGLKVKVPTNTLLRARDYRILYGTNLLMVRQVANGTLIVKAIIIIVVTLCTNSP